MIVGPVTGLLKPDELFAELLFPLVSLSVAVILFEGSLTLKLGEIRGHGSVVRNLITIGALITWLITAIATHYLIGFPYELSFLFGAVVVVTGPTVIMPILRTVRPNAKIANILRWEGIVIDQRDRLHIITAEQEITPEPGWTVISLINNQSAEQS
jgi:NhaP-type Na+/H+ or K+/H+ antiporter